MKIKLNDARIELERNQILNLSDALDVRIACVSGALWITQDRDRRDIVLKAGESFTIDRDNVVLVSAVEKSVIAMTMPAPVHLALINGLWTLLARPVQALQARLSVPGRHPAIELHSY